MHLDLRNLVRYTILDWRKIQILWFSIILISTTSRAEHDYHIGIIDIHYNDSSKALEVAVKMFVHDFEAALKKQGIENLQLGTTQESDKADEYVIRYFLKNLEISLNDSVSFGQFIGKEVEDEHLWTYWEITKVQSLKKVGVKATMLFEIFDDQSFIVYLQNGILKESMLLNRQQPREFVIFE
ncbi:MAG: hypothetical protein MRY83_00295 [Flavobacteriales bacterium]|nr:hypothetical protein [Flavobacteriales bacterium]